MQRTLDTPVENVAIEDHGQQKDGSWMFEEPKEEFKSHIVVALSPLGCPYNCDSEVNIDADEV